MYLIKDANGHVVTVRGKQLVGMDNIDSELKEFSDSERSFLAVASAESPDRMGDIISQKGWMLDNYRKNPVVMPFHNYRALPVGRSLEEIIKGKRLLFRPQFAPTEEATLMYNLYRDKYLKGFSVGFIPIKSEPIKDEEAEKKGFYGGKTKFIEQELLEVSVAPVPAHPDALSEIKTFVKKGILFVHPRYLQDESGHAIEQYDDYIHWEYMDSGKFKELFIAPLLKKKDDNGESTTAWIVFGYPIEKIAQEDCFVVQRIIFLRSSYSLEEIEEISVREDNGVSITKISTTSVKLQAKGMETFDVQPFTTYKKNEFESTSTTTIDIPCADSSFNTIDKDLENLKWDDIVGEELTLDEVLKPYPNEHACRLKDPDGYESFKRSNCYKKSDGKCIDFIFGKKEGKTELQAMRYKKDVWEVAAAKSHCANHKGTFEEAKAQEQSDDIVLSIKETLDAFTNNLTVALEKVITNVTETLTPVIDSLTNIVTELKNVVEQKVEQIPNPVNGNLDSLDIDFELEQDAQDEVVVELEPDPDEVELDISPDDVRTLIVESQKEGKEKLEKSVRSVINNFLGRLDDDN